MLLYIVYIDIVSVISFFLDQHTSHCGRSPCCVLLGSGSGNGLSVRQRSKSIDMKCGEM